MLNSSWRYRIFLLKETNHDKISSTAQRKSA